MATAINDLIANLRANRGSAESAPMIGDIDLMVAAFSSFGILDSYVPSIGSMIGTISAIPSVAMFIRLGDIVLVWGKIVCGTFTSASPILRNVSIPIASNMTLEEQLCGNGSIFNISNDLDDWSVTCDTVTQNAQFKGRIAAPGQSGTMFYRYAYQVTP